MTTKFASTAATVLADQLAMQSGHGIRRNSVVALLNRYLQYDCLPRWIEVRYAK